MGETALQEAGLVERRKKRGTHRKRRPRRAMPGMMLHIDASEHAWFGDGRKYELIVILDDATSEIYYAQLEAAESTRSILKALCAVVRERGVFCGLYSDRAGHFFVTPKAHAQVDQTRLTQVGRALQELGIKMIPAYSPQARGPSERSFGTWQGRLPQELRVRGITQLEKASEFLREEYVASFNRKFSVAAAQKGTAFVRLHRRDLDVVFSVQQERVVNQDNTIQLDNRVFQIEKTRWRDTLAGAIPRLVKDYMSHG